VLDVVERSLEAIVESRAVRRDELADLVVRGSFPEAVSRAPGRRRAWFDSYASTSVTRVVNQIADLERVAEIPRLLRLLAARSAEELNVTKLASEFGWAALTIDAYLAQLSSAFILQLLPAWSVNLSSKVVHRPKVHLLDTGLAAALCGLTAQRLLDAPERFGGLLETFVVMELRKQLNWSETQPSLWHFRYRGGAEVDVVLEYPDGRVVGIEVKSGATPSCRHLSHTATVTSAEPRTRALARWAESAPRSRWRTATPPASRSTSAESSIGRIDAQNVSQSSAAAEASDSVRERLRPAAARAAQTSGYASRLDNAASHAFHNCAANSEPVSSSTSFTSALESK